MSDLISRQAAIGSFDGLKVDEENCTEYDIGYNDGIDLAVTNLSVLTSAQPEIIRCKDCAYWDGSYCVGFLTTDPDGCCSWGERRGE